MAKISAISESSSPGGYSYSEMDGEVVGALSDERGGVRLLVHQVFEWTYNGRHHQRLTTLELTLDAEAVRLVRCLASA